MNENQSLCLMSRSQKNSMSKLIQIWPNYNLRERTWYEISIFFCVLYMWTVGKSFQGPPFSPALWKKKTLLFSTSLCMVTLLRTDCFQALQTSEKVSFLSKDLRYIFVVSSSSCVFFSCGNSILFRQFRHLKKRKQSGGPIRIE